MPEGVGYEQDHDSLVKLRNIAWAAGLLEGEGWFGYANTPQIVVSMTDRDVIARMGVLLQARPPYSYQRGRNKTVYRVGISGHKAVAWMMTLYSFLGERRREKVAGILRRWKGTKAFRRDGLCCQCAVRPRPYRPEKNTYSGWCHPCRSRIRREKIAATRLVVPDAV